MLTEEQEKEGQVTDNQEEQQGASFMDEVWEATQENAFDMGEESGEESKPAEEKPTNQEKPDDSDTTEKEGEAKDKQNSEEENQEEDTEEKDSEEEGEEQDKSEGLPDNYKELVETIKGIDPDAKIENTDDIVKYSKKLGEDLLSLKKENEDNQKIYQEFVEVLEADPVAANFMNDLKNGASFEQAVMLNIDPENIDIDDDPDLDKIKERKKERQEQYKAMRERQGEIEQNKNVSVQNIEAFAKENEYDNGQMGKFISSIQDFMNDYDKGLISKKFLQTLDEAMNADSKAQKKADAARISARNEKMASDAMKKKKKQKGDGVPHLKGNNKVREETKAEVDAWTQAIDEYEQGQIRL